MSPHGIRITQQELHEIYELEREILQKQERVDHPKSNLKALLFEKMPLEQGRFDAKLVFRTVRHPAWKQAVIDNLGGEFAEEFRRAAPSNTLCEVMVEEHAVPPLWKQIMGTSETES